MKTNVNKEKFDQLWNAPNESLNFNCSSISSVIYLNFEFPYFGEKFTKLSLNCQIPGCHLELKSNLTGTISLLHNFPRSQKKIAFDNHYSTDHEIIIKWYWNSTVEVGLILDRNGKISMLYKTLPMSINLPPSTWTSTNQHPYSLQKNYLTMSNFSKAYIVQDKCQGDLPQNKDKNFGPLIIILKKISESAILADTG